MPQSQEFGDPLPEIQEPTSPLLQPSAPEDDGVEYPYNDPFFEDLPNVMANPNPNLMEILPLNVDATKLQQELDLTITDYNNDEEYFDALSFVDDGFTISWDMFEPSNDDLNENINNDVPGEIGNNNGNNNVGETTRLEVSTRVFGDVNGPNFETGGTSTPVPVPIISAGTIVCSCCKILRELVHMKDGEMDTLIIFGGIGFLCHALLMTQVQFASDLVEHHQPQTFHLKNLTMEEVKRFIEDYCSQRVARGLSLVQDTNAAFYQAMSANSIFNESPLMLTIPSRPDDVPMSLVSPDDDVPPVPLHVGPREEPTTGVPKERERRKTRLAAQRERTGKLTLKDVSMLFHLPIEKAAKQMSLCPTVLKKICRKGGLMRWPHRKIKSLQTKIASLKRLLCTAKNGEVKVRVEAEIERLQRQIDKICGDILKNMK